MYLINFSMLFPQRLKSTAAVRVSPAQVSVMLPSEGSLVDVMTRNGQSYIRDIQKELIPRNIALVGFRWHNGAHRGETQQILRYLTIRKGGVYAHWDALNARSGKKTDAMAMVKQCAASHAHAARNHQLLVRAKVVKLFEQTPADDVRLISIKEEVFGIPDGRPIIDNKHPVLRDMFLQPIVGALCCFIFLSKQVVSAF